MTDNLTQLASRVEAAPIWVKAVIGIGLVALSPLILAATIAGLCVFTVCALFVSTGEAALGMIAARLRAHLERQP